MSRSNHFYTKPLIVALISASAISYASASYADTAAANATPQASNLSTSAASNTPLKRQSQTVTQNVVNAVLNNSDVQTAAKKAGFKSANDMMTSVELNDLSNGGTLTLSKNSLENTDINLPNGGSTTLGAVMPNVSSQTMAMVAVAALANQGSPSGSVQTVSFSDVSLGNEASSLVAATHYLTGATSFDLSNTGLNDHSFESVSNTMSILENGSSIDTSSTTYKNSAFSLTTQGMSDTQTTGSSSSMNTTQFTGNDMNSSSVSTSQDTSNSENTNSFGTSITHTTQKTLNSYNDLSNMQTSTDRYSSNHLSMRQSENTLINANSIAQTNNYSLDVSHNQDISSAAYKVMSSNYLRLNRFATTVTSATGESIIHAVNATDTRHLSVDFPDPNTASGFLRLATTQKMRVSTFSETFPNGKSISNNVFTETTRFSLSDQLLTGLGLNQKNAPNSSIKGFVRTILDVSKNKAGKTSRSLSYQIGFTVSGDTAKWLAPIIMSPDTGGISFSPNTITDPDAGATILKAIANRPGSASGFVLLGSHNSGLEGSSLSPSSLNNLTGKLGIAVLNDTPLGKRIGYTITPARAQGSTAPQLDYDDNPQNNKMLTGQPTARMSTNSHSSPAGSQTPGDSDSL